MKNSPKSSSSHLFECYIWLVNTILRGPISRPAIDDKWARASVNDYKQDSIADCTFHRWRNNAQQLFDVTIKCNSHGEYYIEDGEHLRNENWHSRMFLLFAMNSLIKDSKELRDRILHEPVPSGEKHLTTIVEAMRDNCLLKMTYQGFARTEPSTYEVAPYCLKMFKQRWYMLAHSPAKNKTLIYSLDRIQALEPTRQSFVLPKDFDAEFYFRNTYGVSGTEEKPQKIKISVSAYQANYFRTLPLHPSQIEEERHEDHSVFSFFMNPSYEFCQELRKYGPEVQILSPVWLRNKFLQEAKSLIEMYSAQ